MNYQPIGRIQPSRVREFYLPYITSDRRHHEMIYRAALIKDNRYYCNRIDSSYCCEGHRYDRLYNYILNDEIEKLITLIYNDIYWYGFDALMISIELNNMETFSKIIELSIDESESCGASLVYAVLYKRYTMLKILYNLVKFKYHKYAFILALHNFDIESIAVLSKKTNGKRAPCWSYRLSMHNSLNTLDYKVCQRAGSCVFHTKFIKIIKNTFLLGLSSKKSSIYNAFVRHDLSETHLVRCIYEFI